MKQTRRDHSGEAKLPPVPKSDRLLYHWSPSTNRDRINHYGLEPGRPSLQGDWKPPYVCFSDDPILAWQLSGRMYPYISEWDLWVVNVCTQDSFKHYEIITDTFIDTGRHYIKEYRIYDRVYKRDVMYVATRRHNA